MIAFPLVARLLRGPTWQDHPRVDRHHRRVVARSGGIAWCAGILVSLAIGLRGLPAGSPSVLATFAVLAASLALAGVLGRADDLGRIGPARKQALQAALLLGSWLAVRRVLPALSTEAPIWPIGLAAITVALAVQLALNIFDHFDGNLATVAAAGCLVSASGDAPLPLAWVAAAAGGASLGFLFWNRPSARGFLGNQGSQMVALLCALLVAVQLTDPRPDARRPLVLLPFLWPLFDLVFVAVRRTQAGRKPWEGGRDHTTHLLARTVRSEPIAWLLVVAVTGGLAAMAVIRMTP